MKIKQIRPDYFDEFEDEINEVNNLEELKNIPWIKNIMEQDNFYGLFYSGRLHEDSLDLLMALTDYDKKSNKCKSWWVIGGIYGKGSELGLEEAQKYMYYEKFH